MATRTGIGRKGGKERKREFYKEVKEREAKGKGKLLTPL